MSSKQLSQETSFQTVIGTVSMLGGLVTASLAIGDFQRSLMALGTVALLVIAGVAFYYRSRRPKTNEQAQAIVQELPPEATPQAQTVPKEVVKEIRRTYSLTSGDFQSVVVEARRGERIDVSIMATAAVSAYIFDADDFEAYVENDDDDVVVSYYDEAEDVLEATLETVVERKGSYIVVVECGRMASNVRLTVAHSKF